MRPIVQCVPNISEGRDKEKIERIIEPLKDHNGFHLVSYEPDADYNRTVITLLGDPEEMLSPLLAFIERARELIDMNKHKGEHPRMGAVDVLPFIPISGIDMEACTRFANQLGKRIAGELDIPVFLYGEAATKKKRKRLPNIRKGEFEGMKEKIRGNEWHPDYGSPRIHPSFGTIAVGARLPLIAYNIDLATDNIEIAKRISRAIRGSSGGFKHVQAGPAHLQERGHVQVTMNILNYKQNPLYRILETVKMEALRHKVDVPSSEIVGLIPKDTIIRSLRYYYAVKGQSLDEEDMRLSEIAEAAKEHFGFRDFGVEKIIEANIEED